MKPVDISTGCKTAMCLFYFSLMTVHRSEGLEWPVVAVVDLARQTRSDDSPILLDPEIGAALKGTDSNTDDSSCLFRLLRYQKARRESDEHRRVLYVATTRARDYLILTATKSKGDSGSESKTSIGLLTAGLTSAGITTEEWPFSREDSLPPVAVELPAVHRDVKAYLDPIEVIPSVLPVTSLAAYEECPLKFHYSNVEGHPGLSTGGSSIPIRRGNLVHFALQHDIQTARELGNFDRSLHPRFVHEALDLANRFRSDPVYAAFRGDGVEHEVPISLRLGRFDFSGRIDLLGAGFVVDFKTGRRDREPGYQLQLLLYALAAPREKYVLAYLSEGDIARYSPEQLKTHLPRVEAILDGISAGDYQAKPSEKLCERCRYRKICPASMASSLSTNLKNQSPYDDAPGNPADSIEDEDEVDLDP